MKTEELRSLQAPLKERYRERPETALVTLRAEGRIGRIFHARLELAGRLLRRGYIQQPAATVSWLARATCCSRLLSPVPV